MSCNVFDAFAQATQSLAQDVYKRASYRSMWLNMIQRGEYPQGTGLTQTSFISGPIEPDASEDWSAVTTANGSNGGACDQTYTTIDVGFDSVNWSPEQFNLQGPELCKDDLTFDHRIEAFLNVYLEKLSIRAQRSWERRYEALFSKFSLSAVANASFDIDSTIPSGVNQFAWKVGSSTGKALNQATSELTQEMLDQVAVNMIRNGATNPDEAGFISYSSDGPVFPLYIGLEASQRIAQNSSDFRTDLRYADMGSDGVDGSGSGAQLLKRIGANRQIKNFRHVPNLFPPRFTYGSGVYTYVEPFVKSASTGTFSKGYKWTVNPSWTTAPYEGAFVATPWVFKSHVIRPVNQVGNLAWKPTNYMGEWIWVTGAYKFQTDSGVPCVDPLDTKGRHFAQFKHAPEPIFTNQGFTIFFKRCAGNLTTITCS
jgi:hypothetical protein